MDRVGAHFSYGGELTMVIACYSHMTPTAQAIPISSNMWEIFELLFFFQTMFDDTGGYSSMHFFGGMPILPDGEGSNHLESIMLTNFHRRR